MANGKPYAWFDTLVAMCASGLGLGPAGTPTNRQLAARRKVKVRVIERHVTSICEAFGFDTDDKGARNVIVQIAIDQGLVIRADLAGLGRPRAQLASLEPRNDSRQSAHRRSARRGNRLPSTSGKGSATLRRVRQGPMALEA